MDGVDFQNSNSIRDWIWIVNSEHPSYILSFNPDYLRYDMVCFFLASLYDKHPVQILWIIWGLAYCLHFIAVGPILSAAHLHGYFPLVIRALNTNTSSGESCTRKSTEIPSTFPWNCDFLWSSAVPFFFSTKCPYDVIKFIYMYQQSLCVALHKWARRRFGRDALADCPLSSDGMVHSVHLCSQWNQIIRQGKYTNSERKQAGRIHCYPTMIYYC